MQKSVVVSVLGLGYVGLPVAVHMSKKFLTIGFDIDGRRIEELRGGTDSTLEIDPEDLVKSKIKFTSDIVDLKEANFHIVAVPTPVNDSNRPDLTLLLKASSTIGSILKKGDVVVYESTVYPGATEEDCIPVLERASGLVAGRDFKVGYSPERINPGDKEHSFTKIMKVVSAQDQESLDLVSFVYSSVVEAGVFKASSIKVAEAAKVIENTQRDINIALMNELSIICGKMNIDTGAVLSAAATKWNFLSFKPGLVGGHCIGVDPYYLTHKAEQLGYHPQVILAGRRINDSMANYYANQIVKKVVSEFSNIGDLELNIFGVTFKENCPDLRNSKVFDLVKDLEEFNFKVNLIDPVSTAEAVNSIYKKGLLKIENVRGAKVVILAVGHQTFVNFDRGKWSELLGDAAIVFDLKGVISPEVLPENVKLIRF